MGKSDYDPPDYQPLAQASEESARIMGELGQRQLDFARQQYEESKPFFRRLVDQQIGIGDQTARQGEDYYEYMKSFRPAERAMFNEAMRDRSAEIAAFDAANRADAEVIAGQDVDVYNRFHPQIEWGVGKAIADAQGAYTQAINQAIRQGLRYGGAPSNIIGQVGSIGIQQAQNIAAAANAARQQGITQQRTLAQTALGLRGQNLDALNRQRAIDWAKKLDVSGLVRGMPGASQGAYGLAVSAGDSAARNQLVPGSQYMAGMAQGAGTIGQGRSLLQSGLGNVLNAQTQLASTAGQHSPLGDIGAILGAAARFYTPGKGWF